MSYSHRTYLTLLLHLLVSIVWYLPALSSSSLELFSSTLSPQLEPDIWPRARAREWMKEKPFLWHWDSEGFSERIFLRLSTTACPLHLLCPKAQFKSVSKGKVNLSFNARSHIIVLFVLIILVILIPSSQKTFLLYIWYHSKVWEVGKRRGPCRAKLQSLEPRNQLRSGSGLAASLNLAQRETHDLRWTLDYTTVISQIASQLNN